MQQHNVQLEHSIVVVVLCKLNLHDAKSSISDVHTQMNEFFVTCTVWQWLLMITCGEHVGDYGSVWKLAR